MQMSVLVNQQEESIDAIEHTAQDVEYNTEQGCVDVYASDVGSDRACV